MATLKSVMDELKAKASEKTRATYARHGMASERVYGVSVADMKLIAKRIQGEQTLALELYATGIMEPMYLAGMVAHGTKMSCMELQAWADGSGGMQMIAEYTVPWVTVENEAARELAVKWIASKEEHRATSGWCTYSGLVAMKPESELDLNETEELLSRVVNGIGAAPNRVRYTMNGFVIAVGIYGGLLSEKAKAAARKIGAVSVDVGDTACQVPLAIDSIAKAEAAGRTGKKRKTIRC